MVASRTSVRHPWFARMYERMAPAFDAKGGAAHRDELLAGLSGRVVEVGAGTGLNFGHYPETVTEVVAIEPEPYLRAKAELAAEAAPIPITVVDGVADQLPVETGSCDAGVASLVLCSVADQAVALGELYRVIRPGGELRFYEHIRSSSPALARVQRALDVVWPRLVGGCHTSRDTVSAVSAGGFEVEHTRYFTFRPMLTNAPVAPHVIGVARRPSGALG
jgi:ubiquinone/menaquinone biosynthesis C-methylase UbiE